jgi:hypothetical protein
MGDLFLGSQRSAQWQHHVIWIGSMLSYVLIARSSFSDASGLLGPRILCLSVWRILSVWHLLTLCAKF